ncbi:MAG: hypothetical protein PF440_11890 [Thiomicrorhabdus sp.]|jgi:predicted HTH transcriptional regulator|nr:hypothetical protein [Thiomicrorhabdus sp.]
MTKSNSVKAQTGKGTRKGTRKLTTLTTEQKIADLTRKLELAHEATASANAATAAANAKNNGRAEQALTIIKAQPIFTTASLAADMGIESKNASSVLNALKKRQYRWVKAGDNFIYMGKMADAVWNTHVIELAVYLPVEVKKEA